MYDAILNSYVERQVKTYDNFVPVGLSKDLPISFSA